VKSKKDTWRKG